VSLRNRFIFTSQSEVDFGIALVVRKQKIYILGSGQMAAKMKAQIQMQMHISGKYKSHVSCS
jgi:vacuolar-type H+-ATPase subunit B/Vma2